MFNYLCEECGKGTVTETVIKNYEINLFKKPFVVPSATIGLCDKCGVRNYHGNEMHRWKDLYGAWETKSADYLSPSQIRVLRNTLGLNQRDFAAFIGVTRQSLSVWENNKRPSVQPQSVDIILQLLFDELKIGEKPVTEKMVKEYNKRTDNFISLAVEKSQPAVDRNSVLKSILPQTTWDALTKKAKKNETDPFTESVISIEKATV